MLRTRRLTGSACVVGLVALLGTALLTPLLPASADAGDGSLTVTVERDVDANGSYDSAIDVPQAGITITVSDAGGASVKGTTDNEGTYAVEPTEKLRGGRYFVVAEVPATLDELSPVPAGGSFEPLSTTVDVTSEDQTVRMGLVVRSEPVPAEAAAPPPPQALEEQPAPEVRPAAPRFAVGDLVWNDRNRSGTQDAGEVPAAGVSVQLLDRGGAVVASTVSSPTGHYLFDTLAAGTYSVRFAGLPTGFKLSAAQQGDNRAEDSDPDYAGNTAPFTLGVGEPDIRAATGADGVSAAYINTAVDAGMSPMRYAVGSRVWLDLNGDGLSQPDEPAAPAIVTLLTKQRMVKGSVATDAEGRFLFRDLPAGDYQLQFSDLGPHRAYTSARVGQDAALDSNADPRTGLTPVFTLGQSASDLVPGVDAGLPDIDFVNPTVGAGVVGVYSIGDTVWRDANNDSVLDAGDAGVEGVRVELYDTGLQPLATTVTSATGRYSFSGLSAGTYHLEFSDVPRGLVFAAQRVGTNTAVDSDANADGATDPVVLGADNPADTTVDAGLTTKADRPLAVAAESGSASADTVLSPTGGVAAQVPLSGLGLVLGGVASLLVGRRWSRSAPPGDLS